MERNNSEAQRHEKLLMRHDLRVSYLSVQKRLCSRLYDLLEDLATDAFALFEDRQFNMENAIITYFDDRQVEKLLRDIPIPDRCMEIYIRHVRLVYQLKPLNIYIFMCLRFIRSVPCA